MRRHHAFAQKPNQLFNRTPTGFAGSRPLTQALGLAHHHERTDRSHL